MEVKSLGRTQRNLDNESAVAIYHGLSISQLCTIMEMDRRDIAEKLEKNGIKPSGKNGGHPIYKLKDVMPALVKPMYDIETYLRQMHHNDLPKHLTKEFWAGLRSRQEYEIKAGDLWPTEKIISEVGELMKMLNMSLSLAADTVERQVELSEEQRLIIKNLIDGVKNDMVKSIQDKFSSKQVLHDGDEEASDEAVSDDW